MGSPIGTPYTDSASEEPTGSSKRTVNRLIRGKTREVVEELTSVVFPAFNFDRPTDSIYDDEELLLLETLLGVTGTAANGGAETYGDYVNPEPNLDDPFYEDGPSGETLLTGIKNLEPEEITEMANRGAARVLTRAKPHVEFERPVMIAIDMTYVAYYGKREELVRVLQALSVITSSLPSQCSQSGTLMITTQMTTPMKTRPIEPAASSAGSWILLRSASD
jgi:hypothetical protein